MVEVSCRLFFSCSVDASEDDGSLGRLVNNDDIKPNCKMKTVVYEGKPHLCLFAVKEITQGEEITYNYGDSSCPLQSTVGVFSAMCLVLITSIMTSNSNLNVFRIF